MTKRRLSTIAGCAAALLTAVGSPSPAAARTGPVQLGAAVYTEAFQSDPDPRYRATLAGYDSITAETAMKIQALQPQRGQFEFAAADAMVSFAEAHGQQVFGHTLSWCSDSSLPGWLRNGSWSRASLLTVLEQHITAVMSHFRGRVSAWDVVNEALNQDGSRRDCLWKRVIGDDWIDNAFRFARSADPGAKLFYNEYGAEVPNPKHEATVNLIRDLRPAGRSDRRCRPPVSRRSSPSRPRAGRGGDPPARRSRGGRPHQRDGRSDLVVGVARSSESSPARLRSTVALPPHATHSPPASA